MAYIRLNVTIPKESVEKLKKIAEKEKRSLSNMITFLIEKYEIQVIAPNVSSRFLNEQENRRRIYFRCKTV